MPDYLQVVNATEFLAIVKHSQSRYKITFQYGDQVQQLPQMITVATWSPPCSHTCCSCHFCCHCHHCHHSNTYESVHIYKILLHDVLIMCLCVMCPIRVNIHISSMLIFLYGKNIEKPIFYFPLQ